MRKELKDLLTGLFVLIFYLFSFSIISDIALLFNIDYYTLSSFGKQLFELIYELILVFIIIFIFRKTFIPNLKEFMNNKKEYLDKYFKYWILILGGMLLSNIAIAPFVTDSAANQTAVVDSLKSYPLIMFIESVLIAPILEELIFRLGTRKMISKSKTLYIIMAGLLFGFMHVIGETQAINYLYIIPYSFPGFVFAYMYLKSDNICVPMSIHMIHNFVLVIMNLFI